MSTVSGYDKERGKPSRKMLVTLIAAAPFIYWIVGLFS